MRTEASPVTAYLKALHPLDSAAEAMAARARAIGLEHMALSAAEARFLGLLVQLIQPRLVVEFGCFMGFSALHMARHLPAGGRLISWEKNPDFASMAREGLAEAGLADRIEIILGNAVAALDDFTPPAPVDMVFIDADKASYPAYFAWCEKHLTQGGLLVADNTLLFGEIATPNSCATSKRSTATQRAAMQQFNQQVMQHPCFEASLLPTVEGMMVAVRTSIKS